MRILACAALAAIFAASSYAQSASPKCVDVSAPKVQGAFTGVLEKHTFAGPPNWDNAANGDKPLPTFILRLPKKICAQDGNQFANPTKMFDDIHVSGRGEPPPWDWLNAHVGQKVTLNGDIFAAHTIWHRAPLVLLLPKGWTPSPEKIP